jgi:hypothetical protein
MQIDVSSQIALADACLRLAMLASDVAVLEELISPARSLSETCTAPVRGPRPFSGES